MAMVMTMSFYLTLSTESQFGLKQARARMGTSTVLKVNKTAKNALIKSMLMPLSSSAACGGGGIVKEKEKKDRRRKLYPGEGKGFVEELRFVAMRLHTTAKEEGKETEKEVEAPPVGAWEPSIEGYVKFLVDSKLVYDKLETIIRTSTHPSYTEFKTTGLERSEKLAKDLEWFVQQGYSIPGPSSPGTSYSQYLEELAEKDPPAFICHFYNIYFAHTAGGRMIGRQVSWKLLNGRELEFYNWGGDLPQMLKNVKEKLNKVAEGWSRSEKNRCLAEAAKSFKYSGCIIRLIIL